MKQHYFWRILFLIPFLYLGTVSHAQTNISEPTLIKDRTYSGVPWGTWLADPLETNGRGLIWVIPHYNSSQVLEYASQADLLANNVQKTYNLPLPFDGTGHVIYDGNLYYNKGGTNHLIKYNLASETILLDVPLPDAGYRNTYYYGWGGYTDIDFAVDDNGLWVLYSTTANAGRLVVSKLDPTTLTATSTWNTSGMKRGIGDAFIIDGVVYSIAAYYEMSTTINYLYDTNTSTGSSTSIPWTNPETSLSRSYLTSAQFNPNDGLIYVYNDGRLYTYATDYVNPCMNDTEPPVITCTSDISVTNTEGEGGSVVNFTPTFTDNCTGGSIVTSPESGSFFNIGTTEVTVTATDAAGNKATCTFDVTVTDSIPPMLACPGDITLDAEAGLCTANVDFSGDIKVLLLAADSESFVTDVQDKLLATGAFDAVDIFYPQTGTPTEEYLASYQTVFFWTNSRPLENTLLGDRLAAYIDNGGGVVSMVFANASIPVAGAFNSDTYLGIIPESQTQGSLESIGTIYAASHPIMEGITNFNGGSSSYRSTSQTLATGAVRIADWTDTRPLVVVKENVGPKKVRRVDLNFFPPSSDVSPGFWDASTDGILLMQNAALWVAETSSGNGGIAVSDNSGEVTLTNDFNGTANPSGAYPVGTTTVTLTATDASGNTSTCSFKVTVEDKEAPDVVTKNFTVELDADGTGSIAASDVVETSSDNCETVTFSLSKDSFDCSNLGANTIEVTATDASDNETTVEATVTVEDNIAPALTTKAYTLELDSNGTGSIVASDVVEASSDNCETVTFTLSKDSFDCSNVGANTIDVTATDASDNEITVEATVTVEDNIAPALTTKAYTVELDANGTGSIVASDVVETSSDNCETVTFSLSKDSFDCSNLGANTIEVTATDASGNETTVEATVTVEDNIAPALTTKAYTVELDANGTGSIVASDVVEASSDNCETVTFTLSKDSFDCSNLGANTIEVTATDASGNETTVEATVTVEDNIAPALTTKAYTVELDADGTGSILASDVVETSSDNCETVTFSLSKDSFDCSNLGANTIDVTATDASGNETTVEATVNVEDNIAPALTTKAYTVELDANGTGSIVASDVVEASSDNCETVTFTLSKDSFDCSNVGANTIDVTATDASGNETTVEATVNVEDNIAPALTTKAYTVELDANGTGSIVASDVVEASSDNCETVTFTLSKDSFDCSNVGANTIEVTATDASGNETTVEATVTVEDNIAPALTTKAYTVELDANGTGSIVASDVVEASSDNCETVTFTLSKDSFDCSNVGANTIEVTATDASGNETTVEATVTVEDNIAPALTTRSYTVELDANGTGSIVASNVVEASSDNCETVTFSLSKDSFDCSNVGANTIEVTATDASGNETTVEATVTVEDNIAPALTTRAYTVELDANGTGSIIASDVVETSSDNCETVTFTLSKDSFDCSNVGANTIEVTATDASGNETTVEATVNVEDNIAPALTTKAYTVELDANGTGSIVASDVVETSADNCETVTFSLSKDSFDCSNVGANTIDVTATDASGNETTVEATVNVEDNIAPALTTKAYTVELDANGTGSIVASDVVEASSDNCETVTFTLSKDSFDCSNVGANTIEVTATDASGNETTVEATVTVEDNIAPALTTKAYTVELDANGTGSIVASDVVEASSDNCETVTFTLSKDSFDCSNVGANTIEVTATDTSGNETTVEATVTVEDNIAPALTTRSYTVELDANGTGSIVASNVVEASSDNCETVTFSLSKDSFDCSNVGANTIEVTATDASGNETTVEATVTVEDNIAPALTTRAYTVELDANGTGSIIASDVVETSSDNCETVTFTLSKDSFDCSNVGANTIEVTATDASGNETTVEATVTVEDNIAPALTTKAYTVELDANGTGSLVASDVVETFSDNCETVTFSLSKESFDCSNVGANTIEVTATDASGNETTVEATVTVEDNIAPALTTKAYTVALDADGTGSIVASDVVETSSDNCETVTFTLSKENFDCSNVGANIIEVTATDDSGNETTVEATVNVEDNIAPALTTKAYTVALDADGTGSIVASDVVEASSDNCETVTFTLSKESFDCSNTGANTIEVTATDASGNETTVEATVNVEDNIAPALTTKAYTVELDANGTGSIVASDVVETSSDNCETVTFTLSKDSFDCSNVGPNTIEVTATDASGNETTVEVTVNVEDNLAPEVTTRDLTVQMDENGTVSILPEELIASASDNCGIESYSLDQDTFSCEQAETEVSITVTDMNGNTVTVTATVTIEDITAPVVITRDLEVALDASGNVSITAEQLNDGSLDNCGIASFSIDRTSFSCGDTGEHFVILTATDHSGNTASAEAIVTVENPAGDNDVDGLLDNCDDDDDNDGVPDHEDNSPKDYNPDQTDSDGDGEGDISDMDNDNDGINDGFDNCPTVYNPGQEDINKDGVGDVCDKVNILVSEALTPNNDGVNDSWRIVNIENHPKSVVRVYNRWGNEVFSARGYRSDWNGQYKGNLLPEGSYYFQIDLDGNGNMDQDGWLYLTK